MGHVENGHSAPEDVGHRDDGQVSRVGESPLTRNVHMRNPIQRIHVQSAPEAI
jgi:hypothetical protein